jgi:hypothetical protein
MAATQLSVQPPMPAVQPPAPAASAVVTETPAGGRGETRGRGNSAILTQDPAIYEQVLQELKRAHRPSDIALKLSKAHGVRWTDAERFVIEVATRNHSMLQRRTNVTVLFFSGASLLAGLALLVIGILAVMDILAGQPADNLGQAIGTLIGGIALVLGGAIGIYMISRPSSR